MNKEERAERDAEIVALRMQNESMNDIALKYGLTLSGVLAICHKYNVGGKRSKKKPKNNNKKGKESCFFKSDEQIARMVEERVPEFTYVYGSYQGTDSKVKLQCKKCGTITELNTNSVRHHHGKCKVCRERELAPIKEQKEREKQLKREAVAEERKRQALEREKQKAIEREKKKRIVECIICGKRFITYRDNQICCSSECSKRYNIRRKDKRLSRYNQKTNGITLRKLYKRDKGICYLCGNECDWDDKQEINGTIVCGDRYPSIEHIIPLSKGGWNDWDNVKLACRGCNTKKNRQSPIKCEKNGQLSFVLHLPMSI